MDLFCTKDGCKEFASYYCFTCEVKNLLCSNHAADHMMEKKKHDVQKFVTEFMGEDPKNISEVLLKALVNLLENKKKLTQDVSFLIHHLNTEYGKALNFYRNLEFNLVQVIKNVRNSAGKILKIDLVLLKNLTPTLFDQASEPICLPNIPSFSDLIFEQSKNFYEKIYKSIQFSNGLSQIETFSHSYHLARHENIFLKEEQNQEKEELQLFCPNDQELRLINLETLSTEPVIIKDMIPPRQGASAVQIEPGIWFYSFETQACKLDIKHRSFENLAKSRRKYYARGCVYYENSIYLFGGVGGDNGEINVREAEHYSFQSNQWKELPLLPEVMKGTSAQLIDSKIYIVGFGCKSLLEYNKFDTKYIEVVKLNEAPRSKIILGNFIIINRSKVLWQITNSTVSRIELEKEVVCDTQTISSTAETDKFIYFIIWDGILMRFNKFTYSQEVLNYN